MSKIKSGIGFTLIELLIVVAIIAILASIAVPNFLEAQTRAKVSRVKSDQRTLALAMEAYLVDNNTPPLDEDTLAVNPFNWVVWTKPMWWEKRLTTPVSYISKTPKNPFADKNFWMSAAGALFKSLEGSYLYVEYGFRALNPNYQWYTGDGNYYNQSIYNKAGLRWSFTSSGPGQKGDKDDITNRKNVVSNCIGTVKFCSYDATNGTNSFGYIIRSNKGYYTIDKSVP